LPPPWPVEDKKWFSYVSGAASSSILSNKHMSKIETIFGTGLVSLTCPECGTRMRIYLIMPDGPGRDRRTYICDACEHTETIAVKYR
jgi:hypothetical protein